ncbi:dna-directed rna polymerases i and iii subunit rpac1 [Moniliophthora roreri]|uniref:DNA-directed RNA polymerase RpoA/D/Rpb3-type domain-containing protein n=1 Tax=Moniliophthora roreri TaxID=221103 RepID=A0A0W0F577_MONRR|nr:dna-directed rna polymerases i and iii subunit rpac1 [Moniliophthora roreri]
MSASSLHDITSSRLVKVTLERAKDVSSTDYPGHHADASAEEYSWDLQRFTKNLRVEVKRLSNRTTEFDLVGVDASIANAFRRILLAEVPTVAIERVYVWDNTSVIQDEVLAHRLGLIPLNIDPSLMDFRGPDDPPTDRNTMVFKADFYCQKNPAFKPTPNTTPKPKEMYINHEFLAEHLVWHPAGEQESAIEDGPRPGPTNGKIVLAKLRPGQGVNLEVHAVKGVGKDHAKFNPVATASYRLHPYIKITKPIPTHRAEDFKKCFSPDVVKINPRTKEASIDLRGMRNDTMSREVLRDPEFKDCAELGRIRDWFIFSVETESAYKPEMLMNEAIRVMRSKIEVIKRAAEVLRDQGDGDVTMGDT